MQLITGTAHSRGSHVVLHDADLFLMEPDILDRQYATCAKRRLACLGVSPVWDPWFAAHDRYPAATWELCARADWLKSFVPALHMAHENELFGERHAFDTTLYPQAITHPDLIGIEPTDRYCTFQLCDFSLPPLPQEYGNHPLQTTGSCCSSSDSLVDLFDAVQQRAITASRPCGSWGLFGPHRRCRGLPVGR